MQGEAVNQWLDADHVRSLAEGLLVPSPQGVGFPPEEMFGGSFVGFTGHVEAEIPAPTPTMARQSLSDAQSRAASSGILRSQEGQVPTSAPAEEPKKIILEPVYSIHPTKPIPVQPEPVENVGLDPVNPAVVEPERVIAPEPIKKVNPIPTPFTRVRSPQLEVAAAPAPEVKPAVIDSPFKIAHKASEPPRVAFRPLPLSTRLQAFGAWLKEQIPTRAYFICDRHGEIVVDEVGSEKLLKVARTLAHASSSAGRQVGDDMTLGSLHVKIGPDRVMEVVPRHSHFGLVVLGIIVQRPLSTDAVASVSRALGTALAEPSAPGE